tara:strand:+ start:992 stop:1453 length:462 start_codon:yes stop_codon:yes gene_type:complete
VKLALIICTVVFIVSIIAFALLAMQSRVGRAPGLGGMSIEACGPQPNCVSSFALSSSAHYVDGFTVSADGQDEAWNDLIVVVKGAGGNVEKNAYPYLSATFSSKVFGFVDDFECLLDIDAGVIHVRSGSRVGYSDGNVNRARVEHIRGMLNKQ